ncbi:MAG: peptidylprolyl isomerase [Clostridia bacterium]|nr:peptidylprolyl isomerase [Clostridia bacterium]
MNLKNVTALMLAGLLAVSLAACGNTKSSDDSTPESQSPQTSVSGDESASEEASSSQSKEPSVLDQVEDPKYLVPVLKVGDYEVTYGVYRHYYKLLAESMMGEDKTFFEKEENLKKLQEDVLLQCKITAAYFNMAKQAEITLPTEEKLNEEFKEFVETYEPMYPLYYGVSMAEYLEQNAMTLSTFKTFYVLDTYLASGLSEYLSDEKNGMVDLSDEALKKAMEDYRCVKHILVGYTDDLSDEDALKLATDLAKQLREGGDIDALMKEYSNDYQEDGENAYTFTYNEMVKEFEETAFSMEIGEVSDPVKSTYGYHVIVRLEIDEEAFKEDKFMGSAVNKAFAEYYEKQTVSELEAFAGLAHEELMK